MPIQDRLYLEHVIPSQQANCIESACSLQRPSPWNPGSWGETTGKCHTLGMWNSQALLQNSRTCIFWSLKFIFNNMRAYDCVSQMFLQVEHLDLCWVKNCAPPIFLPPKNFGMATQLDQCMMVCGIKTDEHFVDWLERRRCSWSEKSLAFTVIDRTDHYIFALHFIILANEPDNTFAAKNEPIMKLHNETSTRERGITQKRNLWLGRPTGHLREILPGGTKTDTGPPSFWGPGQDLYSLFVQ